MAQQLKALSALIEDLSSVPRIHTGEFKTSCNPATPALGDPMTSVTPVKVLDAHTDIHIHTCTCYFTVITILNLRTIKYYINVLTPVCVIALLAMAVVENEELVFVSFISVNCKTI